MCIWRLIGREILYRKLSFTLGVLSVLVAVGCLVAELTLIRNHDQRTQELVAQKEAETQARMQQVEADTRRQMETFEAETAVKLKQREAETAAAMQQLEDDYRKITKNLGFNILILPKDQSLSDLYADGFPSKYMPETYSDKLAKSQIATINHLLPSLVQRLKWPEQERKIVLFGTRGEVPFLHQDPKDQKKPLLDPVPPGTMVVGYELYRNLKLKVGDKVRLLGQEFTVTKWYPERGNEDDITVWISLHEAQELLNRQGQINALFALECNCADPNRLQTIRQDIAAILPETQVLEKSTEAIARAEARNRAKLAAEEALARARAASETDRQRVAALGAAERQRAATLASQEINAAKTERAEQRQRQETIAAVLVPLATVGCIVWVGLLIFGNVRDRAVEIGILRALGLRRRQVFALFLGKALLVGLLGALLGYSVGTLAGALVGEERMTARLFDPVLLAAVLGAAPLLCGLASWMPALLAARRDPAVILREA